MKNPPTDPDRFNLLLVLDDYLRSLGLVLSDKKGHEQFIQHLAEKAKKNQQNETLIHGLRIQKMFAYFAAALGGCKLITEEDSGDLFIATGNIKRPDFRILLHSGQELFVEVKNFNPNDPLKPYILGAEYAHKLKEYADAFGKPLLFAIYWRRWGIWSLNTLKCFNYNGQQYSLSLTQAPQNDQKSLLGDRLIGITKPLTFRLYTDPKYLRTIAKEGHSQFKIKKACLTAGGQDIVDETEQRLAWYFFLYGSWTDVEQRAHVVNDEILWIDMVPSREDPNPEVDFLMIGNLSEMICRQFNSVTTDHGKVTRLAPEKHPDKFGAKIPKDYKGNVLGIWEFQMTPDEDIFST